MKKTCWLSLSCCSISDMPLKLILSIVYVVSIITISFASTKKPVGTLDLVISTDVADATGIPMEKFTRETKPTYLTNDAILIDVETSDIFNQEHLDGAITIPESELGNMFIEITRLAQRGMVPVVRVYAHKDVQKARDFAKRLKSFGVPMVYYLDFTLEDWKKRGNPVVTRVPHYVPAESASVQSGIKEKDIIRPDAEPPIIGIAMDPNEIKPANYVTLGKTLKVSELINQKLQVKNIYKETRIVQIGIFPPSEINVPLKEGYTEIPNSVWVQPEQPELEVTANSVRDIEIYIKIPREESNFNQKYQAMIEVKTKKMREEETFVLALNIPIFLTTEKIGEENPKLHIVTTGDTEVGDNYLADIEFFGTLPKSFQTLKVEKFAPSSKEGKALIKKYDIDFLPAYIFNNKVEELSNFNELSEDKKLIKLSDSNYLYAPGARPGIYTKRKKTYNTLEIITTSNNLNYVKVMNKLLPLYKEGKISKDIKISVNFMEQMLNVPPTSSMGQLAAAGGVLPPDPNQPEFDEAKRQLYIQKYHPDKFMDYLLLRGQNIYTTYWENNLLRAGLNDQDIKKMKNFLFESSTDSVVKDNYKIANSLGIKMSGTSTSVFLLLDNWVLINDPSLLEKYAAFRKADLQDLKGCCGKTAVSRQ
ncbi:MAG: hypothetical protein BWY26_00882 [Elusimicrobia bacterium ADurb.Bin231]|nr:MAG: hypothetical protein BWY26_00882 [Elusimicrobia bacterium ADurb.Bin231]